MLTAFAFSIGFLIGCGLAVVRHPIFGLLTYVAVLYVHPPVKWWGIQFLPDLRWSLIAAIATLAGLFVKRVALPAMPLRKQGPFWGMIILLVWLIVQLLWALDASMQTELIVLSAKYLLLLILIYRCIDSEKHLKFFLWAHVTGCFYLGFLVLSEYSGGRYEGFDSPGIDEANAGALQVVTAIVVAFSLFLVGRWHEKVAAAGFMPFIVNALVTTISRSGFLALGISGVLFNLFVPKKITGRVRLLSVLGVVLFLSLTNPVYWERISTILMGGEEVEGVDTGAGRLDLMKAQMEMFAAYPLGCGHRCTVVLSPLYLDDEMLTGPAGNRGRASHNTFMSLLVEQGIPGAILYVLLLFWMWRAILRLRKPLSQSPGLLGTAYAATVAILAAITVGDVFVDYLKYEARIWFIGILMVIQNLANIRTRAGQRR